MRDLKKLGVPKTGHPFNTVLSILNGKFILKHVNLLFGNVSHGRKHIGVTDPDVASITLD